MPLNRDSRSEILHDVLASFLVFALVFTIYLNCSVIVSGDSRWTLHVAMSIIREGNFALDEYSKVIADQNHYSITYVDDRPYYFFPSGTPLLITPLLLLVDGAARRFWSFDLYTHLQNARDPLVLRIELYFACFVVALVCVVVFLIARLYLDRKRSFVLMLVFAFCTSAWSTASRGLSSQGPSMLMLSLTLYLLLRARTRPSLVQYAGIPLACSYVVRATNSLSILLITAYVLIVHRRHLLRYLCYAAVVAIPFVAHNLHVYHHFLPPYYVLERIGTNRYFGEALAGNLISPARGLLVYSPILLFVGYGIALKIRDSKFDLLDRVLLLVIFCHWLVVSTLGKWWAGHAYGPRFFTDVLPYLIYFLVPVLREMTAPRARRRWLSISLFSALTAVSLFMHFRGSTQIVTRRWNDVTGYLAFNVDGDPARVWDWSDPQFWRGLRPAKISADPLALSLRTRQATIHEVTVTLINAGDKPLTYRVTASRGVLVSAPPGEILGLASRDLRVTVDATDRGPGRYSLGGLRIDAQSASGRPVEGSPLIVPLGLELLAPSGPRISPAQDAKARYDICLPLMLSQQSAAMLRTYVAPVDILVNSEVQTERSDQVWAIHGMGWYQAETSNGLTLRWAESPAEVYVYSPVRQKATLTVVPVALHEGGAPRSVGEQGTMVVRTDDQPGATFEVHTDEPLVLEVPLRAGWNVVSFELETGNFRPVNVDPASGDQRSLSFALRGMDIILK